MRRFDFYVANAQGWMRAGEAVKIADNEANAAGK